MGRELRALVLLLLVLTAGALRDPRLLYSESINSILLWTPLLALMAMGQMLVIVSRGIDVSIGSTLGFAGVAVGLIFRAHPGLNILVVACIGLGIGLVFGLVNGLLIAWARIPAIIATLGTLSAYRGLTFMLAKGGQIYRNDLPDALTSWSTTGPIKFDKVVVPWLLVIALLACLAAYVFTSRTVWGRNLYAIGSNPEAAHLHGIGVKPLTLLAYTISGSLAGLGGVLYASRYGFVNPASAGVGMELTVIAATVIGGCDVRGGSGTVLGAVIGCTLLASINVALSVVGIESDWQLLVYGMVILVALALDAILGRRRAKA